MADNMNKILIIILVVALLTASFVGARAFLLTGNAIDTSNLSTIKLQVSIPCGGHASLIKSALGGLNGVEKIVYSPVTTFIVYYDSTKTSEAEILALDIFRDYPAREIS